MDGREWPQKILEPPHDKTNKVTVCPVKTQISLSIRPVWSESSLCAQWVLRTQGFLMRTGKTQIRLGGRPGWSESLLGAHAILLVLSWGGSLISNDQLAQELCGRARARTCDPCIEVKLETRDTGHTVNYAAGSANSDNLTFFNSQYRVTQSVCVWCFEFSFGITSDKFQFQCSVVLRPRS